MANNPSSTYADAGGFFPPSAALPSPAPSTASSRAAAGLPRPRSKPLAPGSRKEDYARNYVSSRLLHVSRRYVKHFGLPEAGDAVAGYAGFDEVCADLDDVVGVLWFSGTPTLQVPYLLSVALAVREYAASFPPAPRPTFALLQKLDHCFASLLAGRDARSHEPLPGFERGAARGMTKTDMVRCKSLAEETRSIIAVLMSGEADVENYAPEEDEDSGGGGGGDKNSRLTPLARPGKRRREEEEQMTPGLEQDVDDDDDEDTEDDVRTQNSSPKRRRSDTPPKRKPLSYVKDEESEADASLAAIRSPHPGNEAVHVPVKPEGQFHWALEDDLSDDDDDDGPKSGGNAQPAAAAPAPAPSILPPTPSAGQPQTPPVTGAVDAAMTDADEPDPGADDEDDDDETAGEADEDEDEDDEEEELHMNVAKVYEKTIMQLGRVLGESLVDD